jgi:hypothetical protein
LLDFSSFFGCPDSEAVNQQNTTPPKAEVGELTCPTVDGTIIDSTAAVENHWEA